ncbi:hypothetical protein HAX54_030583, partial [Datura stramonium]|nr:hypothetical protein [Datura stramonium]
MEEPTARQHSDGLSLRHRGSNGGNDGRQICDGPSLVESCSGCTTPGDGGLDGPSSECRPVTSIVGK